MADRPSVLTAKVAKLAQIISDAEPAKGSAASVADVRQAQAEAAQEVIEGGGSVSEIDSIPLPSERVS